MTTAQAQVRGGLLDTVKSVQLTLSADHNPGKYYRARRGLYVWDDFRARVVAKAKPMAAGTSFAVNVHELADQATDADIEASLPEKHLFDESAVCAIVAEMIRKQPSGEPGDLKNSHSNLLYTRSSVVLVYWGCIMSPDWFIFAGHHSGWWCTGDRVLSPAN